MGFLAIFLLVIFVISAILLIVLVLVQDDQGEGLGSFLGGGSSSAFGSGSNKVLTKFTSVVAAIFIFCSFGLAWVNKTPETGDVVGAARRETVKETSDWWNTKAEESVVPSLQTGTQQTETQAVQSTQSTENTQPTNSQPAQ